MSALEIIVIVASVLFVVGVAVGTIVKKARNKKKGIVGCCDCSSCSACSYCHQAQQKQQKPQD